MPLFEIRPNDLVAATKTSFSATGMLERQDLQRLLKAQIACLDDGLMVLKEEFGEWQDSQRRIDLLCLDTNANLVVVELKRDDDGGHMELQALRYAAMVSMMTFEQAVGTLARGRAPSAPDLDQARADILSFLNWMEPDEPGFAAETRIILVAADFNKEISTTVMWLRDIYNLDIRCVRLTPYQLGDGRLLMDIQQLIPLPEAMDFQTQLGTKRQAEIKDQSERYALRLQFWDGLLAQARERTKLHAGRSPSRGAFISGSSGKSGVELCYNIRRIDSQVHLWISDNKPLFDELAADKVDIETDFGGELDWQRLPNATGSLIRFLVKGGYRSPQDEWLLTHDQLIDAMVRLNSAFRSRLAKSRL